MADFRLIHETPNREVDPRGWLRNLHEVTIRGSATGFAQVADLRRIGIQSVPGMIGMRARQAGIVVSGVLIGIAGSAWVVSPAQVATGEKSGIQGANAGHHPSESKVEPSDRPVTNRVEQSGMSVSPGQPKLIPGSSASNEMKPSIEQRMGQVYRLPFARPTSLEAVRAHLMKTLNIPVVLDLAGLARQEITPEDTVQLELDRVRLKTALQLLLDQVGLTYRIVAEDDLLIITDKQGSDDPVAKIWAEIRELHRDIHNIQDSIDDLTDLLVPEGSDFRMRRPTIIEEMPESEEANGKPVPEGEASTPGVPRGTLPGPQTNGPRPGHRSGGLQKPSAPSLTTPPPTQNAPTRVPLGRPGKRV